MSYVLLQMTEDHIDGAVALQRECFPAPFPEEFLWKPEHLRHHIDIFPQGQLVILSEGLVVASASTILISEEVWQSHLSWEDTVGGAFFANFNPVGTTLYGADLSVHPNFRRQGLGKMLYDKRFDLVKELAALRYGTACRIPDYLEYRLHHPMITPEKYCRAVLARITHDRTLTPLLTYNLDYIETVENYMFDEESGNAAALLEWLP